MDRLGNTYLTRTAVRRAGLLKRLRQAPGPIPGSDIEVSTGTGESSEGSGREEGQGGQVNVSPGKDDADVWR
jgi:hypothetical protein